MISKKSRGEMIANLRSSGTLATQRPVNTITAEDATDRTVKAVHALLVQQKKSAGMRWTAPASHMTVLP